MSKIVDYVKESYNELNTKVAWPTIPESQNSTILVLIASLIFALAILVMDKISENILGVLYNLLTGG